MDYKMVFVVNKSLELRPGSLALYTSRATVGLYKKINAQPQAVTVGPDELGLWGEYGERTVILWADSDQHIKDLELMARNVQLPCQMIEAKVRSPLSKKLKVNGSQSYLLLTALLGLQAG
jgi:peptidyl-tRNA hydrolase